MARVLSLCPPMASATGTSYIYQTSTTMTTRPTETSLKHCQREYRERQAAVEMGAT